ncbi:hypothetical protein CEXT_265391 [Caerostris extrusa]|uniref:Uncharacterized protein n=1 Tax=Caerostris extrusa TaxID=172846 RepID=A0AAV4V3U9_CAEEX|nr:hypothetical protein CEXT_265391 [Caerostris extrusa]
MTVDEKRTVDNYGSLENSGLAFFCKPVTVVVNGRWCRRLLFSVAADEFSPQAEKKVNYYWKMKSSQIFVSYLLLFFIVIANFEHVLGGEYEYPSYETNSVLFLMIDVTLDKAVSAAFSPISIECQSADIGEKKTNRG